MYDVYPDKAQYLVGEDVNIVIESDKLWEGEVTLKIFHLEKCIKKIKLSMQSNKAEKIKSVKVGSFQEKMAGFGIQLWKDNKLVGNTAFDVVEYPGKSLRYGFLSDFEKEDGESNEDISELRKLHINMLQFYDWSYRHDNLVSEGDVYSDMMGKRISLNVVKQKIAKAKKLGIKPIAYGAIYAASKEFYEKHPDWGFYTSDGKPFQFIDIFYIMNIKENCPWHKHIVEQYSKAIKEVGFSGIHMDTYGFPKTAYSRYGNKKEKVQLKKEFAALIHSTKEAISAVEEDSYLIFNNVGNWPVNDIANAEIQAIYIEVWPPYERYLHIKQIINDAQKVNVQKLPVILAAYLEPFQKEDEKRAFTAALLLTAVIISNGAYHLLMGEENAVLTQGYYSNYAVLNKEQVYKMRNYYDFMVRYLELFYDDSLEDITMTHMGGDNYEYQCMFPNWSGYGETDKIWITIRENAQFKTINLINLCGNKENYWNKGKEEPIIQRNLKFRVQIDENIKGIFWASPDQEDLSLQKVSCSYVENEKGRFIEFTIEVLILWGLIVLEKETR